MATYTELYELRSGTALKNKIAVAVTIKAHAILSLASPTATQAAWASRALIQPVVEAEKLMNYVLAANAGATTAQINSAADSAIQDHVNAAVDKLIAGNAI